MTINSPVYSYTGVPIHAIYAQRDAYNSYPSCQRDYVWTKGLQEKLIDSILRGLPVPAITILPAQQHALMGTRFWVVDGQQRLRTILRFRDNKFQTGKSFSLERGLKPIQPNCTYSELSPEAQNAFDFYEIQICKIQSVRPEDTGLIYRRFNYQVSLTFAESLYSYESKVKPLAESLYEHSFWKTVYNGNRERKQLYIMALHIIYMEVMEIMANMTSPQLVELAQGAKDNKLPPNIETTISQTLEGLQHIFYGANFKSIGEIIPIYQAGLLLQQDGYDLHKSKRGCLAPWYMRFKEEAVSSRKRGGDNLIGQLNHTNRQRDFWIKNLPIIYELGEDRLFRKDKKREFSEFDKLKAWNRQEGKCQVCNKPVHITDVGHHLISHTSGGQTTSDNCVLLHKECHEALHNNPQMLLA